MTTEEFISLHRTENVRKLALAAARHKDVDIKFALGQIAGWQQAQRKLPSWAATDGIVFPPHINMEQCSSEATARYKAMLAERLLRETKVATGPEAAASTVLTSLADLTGGFGVDFAFMAKAFQEATYIERNPALCEIARNNFPRLGLPHATIVCADSAVALDSMPRQTLIYVDPARRDEHGSKTVLIGDCTPDITTLLPQLMDKATWVMAKLSPMLDWHKALTDLDGSVAEVHIVALQGECKELLLLLDASLHRQKQHPVRIVCVDLGRKGATFEYTVSADSTDEPAPYIIPSTTLHDLTRPLFLYEPNAAVMKAGCFGLLTECFGVEEASPNSHLFFARSRVNDFPGRSFRIEDVSTMNRKDLRAMLLDVAKANITVRNFPLTADALRKRLRLGDGGDTYLFGFTSAAGEHLLIRCRKE